MKRGFFSRFVVIAAAIFCTTACSVARASPFQIGVKTQNPVLFEIGAINSSLAEVGNGIIAAYKAGHKEVVLRIDSLGGSVSAGEAFSRLIERVPMNVICVVDGQAASMAFYILQSCDVRVMTTRSMLLIHEPSMAGVSGNQHELRRAAEYLEILADRMATHESSRLFISKEELVKKIHDRDWTLLPTEAMEIGAIDQVIEAPRVEKD
jgi:ATP-dependent protease ClpP protease subunit